MIKLTKREKSWIMYDWANSAYAMTVLSTILPIYFSSMAVDAGISKEIATSYWGYINSFASLVVALLSPIMGGLADYMGMKKKFFKFFAFTGMIFTLAIAVVPFGQWMGLAVIYIISVIGFSLGNVFYDSFITDITVEERMDVVSSYGFGFGYIGSTIPFIVCIAIVMLSQKGILPIRVAWATRISFVLTAIWWFVFTLPLIKNCDQKYGKPIEDYNPWDTVRRLGKSFRKIYKDKRAFIFLLAYFFYIDGVDTIIRMATSFGTALGISSTSLLLILLFTQFVAFPAALIFARLAGRFKGKVVLLCAIGVYIGICIYAYFIKSALDFWILSFFVGCCQGGIQALSRSYFAKIIPKDSSNEYFGFYNIFGKFAAIMGPFLIGITTQLTGNVKYGVLSLIALFVIGAILLIRD